MLTKIDINGYRGFKSYKMDGLTRVNLIVGKNNCGKTALLEGIQFLTSRGDPAVLAEVADRRGEIIITGRQDLPTLVDISHFFYNHTIAPDNSFALQGDNGYLPALVKIIQIQAPTEAAQRPTRLPGLHLKISNRNPSVTQSDKHERNEPIYFISREGGVDFDISPKYRRVGAPRRTSSPQMRFVGPDSLNSIDIAVMWDEVTVTGQEEEVASAMRIIEQDLTSVRILTGMFAQGYFPSRGGIVVGLKGLEGRVPLGSMGDGMRRLMALTTSLSFTKKGCLFVDEIDTGLHYSVMSDMWKLIVSKAVASNTQVFATTHSWDCIEGLSILCKNHPELMSEVSIHKIDRSIVHSIPFRGESLVQMVKSDIDPR